MDQFLNQLINGLQMGTIYALIALGYTMVYGIIGLINFAHGDLIMVGSYVAFFLVFSFNIPSFSLALLLAMLVCSVFGVLMFRIAYRPLLHRPRLEALITAMGVSLLLENGARTLPFIGPNYRRFPDIIPLEKYYLLPDVMINNIQIINIVVALVLMVILQYIIKYTMVGMAMRATALDRDAARMMGINIDFVIGVTFAIGGALAGAAGVLVAVSYPLINPYMGILPGLKAFVAAVFGGIGSIPGAVVGGLIMGVLETFATAAYSQMAEGFFFLVLIAVLLFRPAGLVGKKLLEKV
ncbi:MAG: branched-chain amino acid ABC transporter permease [Deltaproteobacteria bacterium]|nr:branched-chain amino acid ABC transporter permease [Deltaproteobacteria bacterium]